MSVPRPRPASPGEKEAGQNAPTPPLSAAERERVVRLGERTRAMRAQLAKQIVGLDEVTGELLVCLFTGSHALLVGVPGLAKTLLVRSIADLVSLKFGRIQFTPDLMPSDITGTEVITVGETGQRVFRFTPGPIFAHLLLADEINRTPPKTQAALMEAMEEGQVTSGGVRHPIEKPFYVLATQNPIEQEGTYPLPAAQLDRFMLNIELDYPSFDEEYEIVRLTTTAYTSRLEPIIERQELLDYVQIVRKIGISEAVLQYATAIARSTRPDEEKAPRLVREWVSWGAGPRAAQFMILGGKARAMMDGRTEATAADVRSVALPVIRHRLILSYQAEAEGVKAADVVRAVLAHVSAPDGWVPPRAVGRGGVALRFLGGR